MKLKKLFSIILCCFCVFTFCGCNGRNVEYPAITMDRYLKATVVSRYNSSNTDMNLSSFIASEPDESTIKLHTYIKFTGITNWIQGMYVECVYFYFYSTANVDINQLEFTMTSLKNANDEDLTLNSGKLSTTLTCKAKKNSGVLLRVDVGHQITEDEMTITIALEDENLSDFGWTIYGLQMYGKIKTL